MPFADTDGVTCTDLPSTTTDMRPSAILTGTCNASLNACCVSTADTVPRLMLLTFALRSLMSLFAIDLHAVEVEIDGGEGDDGRADVLDVHVDVTDLA